MSQTQVIASKVSNMDAKLILDPMLVSAPIPHLLRAQVYGSTEICRETDTITITYDGIGYYTITLTPDA